MERITKQKVIETGKAKVELTTEGHIRIEARENNDFNLIDLKEINEAKNLVAGSEMYTVIFMAPAAGNLSTDAREFSASREVYHNAIAKAIVVKNVAGRLIGRFFITVNKPPSPTKIFKCEKEASNWLTKMKLAS